MIPYDLPLWAVLPWLFILGAVLGSFLNVCVYRIPRHERLWDQLKSLTSPPSSCPRCGNRIPRSDNIPILGWLKLGGRCRFCRGRIAARYPLVELFNGLLFVVVYWMEIPTSRGATIEESSVFAHNGPQIIEGLWSPVVWLHLRYVYHLVLLETLVVASLIDFDLMIIPDAATLPAMAAGVVGGAALGQVFLVPVWFQNPRELAIWTTIAPEWMHGLMGGPPIPAWITESPHLHGLAVSLAGLLVGGGIVWGVRLIGGWVLKREAMGFGDVVLMATIGSFLGWQATLIIFFLAPVCALAVVAASFLFRRQHEIPYGPYLSLAALISLLAWKPIWANAQRIFELGLVVPLVIVVIGLLLAGCLHVMQFGKRLLGIPLHPPQWTEQWTSADQLTHFAGETTDDQQGRWRTGARWPGTTAGRGAIFEERWRGRDGSDRMRQTSHSWTRHKRR